MPNGPWYTHVFGFLDLPVLIRFRRPTTLESCAKLGSKGGSESLRGIVFDRYGCA